MSFSNALMKETFLVHAKMYFGAANVPRGDNFETVPWTWLFDDYLKQHAANPHNVWRPISEIVYDPKRINMCVNPDTIWTPDLEEVCKPALDLLKEVQSMPDILSWARGEAKSIDEPYFVFGHHSPNKEVLVQWMELFSVPNHATIVARLPKTTAAKGSSISDFLRRVKKTKDFPIETVSIKMVQNDPWQHVYDLIMKCLGNSYEKSY
jgi:hypothetical protein